MGVLTEVGGSFGLADFFMLFDVLEQDLLLANAAVDVVLVLGDAALLEGIGFLH